MNNLENVEIGDKVWNAVHGWGGVVDISILDSYLIVVYDNDPKHYPFRYTKDGRCFYDGEDSNPILFFNIPQFYKDKLYPKKQVNCKYSPEELYFTDRGGNKYFANYAIYRRNKFKGE